MKPKTIIIEVIILLVIYAVARLFVPLLVGSIWGRFSALDINFHDTYFVISRSEIAMLLFATPIFLILTTAVYLIKEGFYRYKRKLQNLILIVANFLFLAVMYPLSVLVNMIPTAAGTIYPPLSALSKNIPPISEKLYHHLFVLMLIKQILPFIVVLFMLILVITAVITGKNWHTQPHEQTTS